MGKEGEGERQKEGKGDTYKGNVRKGKGEKKSGYGRVRARVKLFWD